MTKSALFLFLVLTADAMVAGGPPPHAGGPKNDRSTFFRVVDSQGQYVAHYFGSNSSLLREVDGKWLAITWMPHSNSFLAVPAGPVRFEETDCSGVPHVLAPEPAALETYTYQLPGDPRFYFSSGEVVTRVVRSFLLNGSCIQSTSTQSIRPLTVGFDPSAWTPPFRLVSGE